MEAMDRNDDATKALISKAGEQEPVKQQSAPPPQPQEEESDKKAAIGTATVLATAPPAVEFEELKHSAKPRSDSSASVASEASATTKNEDNAAAMEKSTNHQDVANVLLQLQDKKFKVEDTEGRSTRTGISSSVPNISTMRGAEASASSTAFLLSSPSLPNSSASSSNPQSPPTSMPSNSSAPDSASLVQFLSDRKKRQRTSTEQLIRLERLFMMDPLPSQQLRNQIAEELNMTTRQVQIWFQNRRAKSKRRKQMQEQQYQQLQQYHLQQQLLHQLPQHPHLPGMSPQLQQHLQMQHQQQMLQHYLGAVMPGSLGFPQFPWNGVNAVPTPSLSNYSPLPTLSPAMDPMSGVKRRREEKEPEDDLETEEGEERNCFDFPFLRNQSGQAKKLKIPGIQSVLEGSSLDKIQRRNSLESKYDKASGVYNGLHGHSSTTPLSILTSRVFSSAPPSPTGGSSAATPSTSSRSLFSGFQSVSPSPTPPSPPHQLPALAPSSSLPPLPTLPTLSPNSTPLHSTTSQGSPLPSLKTELPALKEPSSMPFNRLNTASESIPLPTQPGFLLPPIESLIPASASSSTSASPRTSPRATRHASSPFQLPTIRQLLSAPL